MTTAKPIQISPAAEFKSREAFSIEIANKYGNVGRNPLVAATNAAADAQRGLGKVVDETNAKLKAQGEALVASVAQVATRRTAALYDEIFELCAPLWAADLPPLEGLDDDYRRLTNEVMRLNAGPGIVCLRDGQARGTYASILA